MDEETKKKAKAKKQKMIIIISIVVGVILVSIITVLLFKKNKELKHAHEEEDVFKDVIRDKKVIEKIGTFVSAAMINDYSYEGLSRTFAKGVTKLSSEQKLQIVFQYLTKVLYANEKITKENIPERYKNDETISNTKEIMSMLSSRTLEKEYTKLFNEEVKYDENSLKKLNTCPSVYKLDTRIKKIFLFNECKTETDGLIITKTYNYKFDNDYYYVYQYVALMKKSEEDNDKYTYWRVKSNKKLKVDDFSGHEAEFETIIWKFDKKYNFISVTNEG